MFNRDIVVRILGWMVEERLFRDGEIYSLLCISNYTQKAIIYSLKVGKGENQKSVSHWETVRVRR